MSVEKRSVYTRVIVRGDVYDEPVIEYGRATYLPTAITVTYTLATEDAGWSYRVETSGPKLKKDGTPGQNVANQRFWWRGELPVWAVEFAEAHRPEGKP